MICASHISLNIIGYIIVTHENMFLNVCLQLG